MSAHSVTKVWNLRRTRGRGGHRQARNSQTCRWRAHLTGMDSDARDRSLIRNCARTITRSARFRNRFAEPLVYNARVIGRLLFAAALGVAIASAPAEKDAASVEWRYYSGDNGAKKYSPLDQI